MICARSEDGLAAARPELERTGAQVDAVVCDVSVESDVARLVEEAVARHGRIDVLVTNAGIIQVGPETSMTVREFENALGVMFWGAVHPTLAVLPVMRSQGGGVILHITSLGGKIPAPHLLPYTTAKFAAVGFSEGCASSWPSRASRWTPSARRARWCRPRRAASLVDRLLPTSSDASRPAPGHAVESGSTDLVAGADHLNRRAARRYHQHDDETRTP